MSCKLIAACEHFRVQRLNQGRPGGALRASRNTSQNTSKGASNKNLLRPLQTELPPPQVKLKHFLFINLRW